MIGRQKAEGRKQNWAVIGSLVCLCALVVVVLVSAVGCGEKVSPAAARSNAISPTPAIPEKVNLPEKTSPPEAATPPATELAVATAEPAVPVKSASATTEKIEPAAKETVDPAQEAKRPARVISFDTVKFEMKKEDPFERKMLTPTIEKLANRKVRIRGYILPSFQHEGLQSFVLVRDDQECCFGPGAALFDCMIVNMNEGKSTIFTTRPIAVEGIFSIREYRDDAGKCYAIYHLQGDKVQ